LEVINPIHNLTVFLSSKRKAQNAMKNGIRDDIDFLVINMLQQSKFHVSKYEVTTNQFSNCIRALSPRKLTSNPSR